MRRNRFRGWAVVAVGTAGLISLFGVAPVLSSVMSQPAVSNYIDEQPDSRRIPGLAYSLAEIECRQWHRNRASRPFNFALRQ